MNTGVSEENRAAFAKAIAMDSRCRIAYLIPHSPQLLKDASVFGWYSSGLHDAAQQIIAVAALPADIREPHTDIQTVLLNRLAGTVWPMVTPIETTSLSQILDALQTPFRICLTSSQEVAEIVDAIVLSSRWPMLHVSTVQSSGRLPMARLDLAAVCKYIGLTLDAMAKDPSWTVFVRRMRQEFSAASRRATKNHPLKRGLHNVVLPNERAMEAFGWRFQKTDRISKPVEINPDPQRYIQRICASADAVYSERERYLKSVSFDIHDYRYVIAVPSIFWGHYKNWRRRVQGSPETIRKDLKHALKNLVHATSYFEYVPSIEVGGRQMPSPAYLEIARERSKDMLSYTATLTAIAASTFAPVIRIEPRVNGVRVMASELARCVRAAARFRFVRKTSRMANQLSEEMRKSIDQGFLARIDRREAGDRIEGLKIIADTPLEFMKSNGLPIGLRFDCSRISPMPGNLFHQIATRPPLHLYQKSFDEVLIIRSFSSKDPLRHVLLGAIEAFRGNVGRIRVKVKLVDVATAAEVVSAINSYDGSIVIFDCHGVYDKFSGTGALMIGSAPLNLWELKDQCQLPPIVMFSACDTQPIDGGHGSVATAAFALGAYAVLGTYFPISANHAAIFNARMLLRLDSYIPAVLASRICVTWREVVSGMLRMSYVIEVMELLVKYAEINLSREQMSSIQLDTTHYISARRPGWHGVLVDRIAEESGRAQEYVREMMDKWCSLTDAVKYVQLGNPERIFISNDFFDPGELKNILSQNEGDLG